MKIGKLAGNELKEIILDKIDHFRADVLLGAGPGEDSAVVDLGDFMLVVSSDPITGAEKNAGFLAVNVACNDLAAAGAEPFGVQVVLLFPPYLNKKATEEIMEEIVVTAKKMNIEVLGGHTEITDLVKKPIITVTALGKADKNELTSSANAKAGDDLYISKGMGIEGSYILANDYQDYLLEQGVSQKAIDTVCAYLNRISVMDESRIARKNGIRAMHDVTEGGVYGAIAEMAAASDLGYIIDKDNFYVEAAVDEICSKLKMDPAALISSGTMLMAVPETLDIKKIFKDSSIEVYKVGKLIEKGRYIIENGEKKSFERPPKDELWKFIEKIT
ncbi:AIR synthase family protein [Halanaerobium sp. Z-7514]|uniref:AIR synthase family protein n=1 Tax=Halanaerobium polyolivorans TaxID=2886943 RepID=A0AAW4WZG1_9FIRM|nr:AIR synthase family protein [Halanaerobium polyolivorans]MCC3144414.1 AIR synthase family protein [Halanaerobium polyolivorans]RQD78221.1 MAG: AIR synthase [Halanaerobium sp. MSAO_Bac5]